MIALDDEEYQRLNPRLTWYFGSDSRVAAHEYSRLIVEMILAPGPLLTEEVLAARLGIDKDKSPDWAAFLAQLPPNAKYKGVFHEAWPRWWSDIVEEKWWYSVVGKFDSLIGHRASERVERLKQYTGLEHLYPPKPIKERLSERFDTICEYYRKPLDVSDGIMIGQDDPTWHERRYISLDVALKLQGFETGLRPHPAVVDRVTNFRESRAKYAKEN